MKIANVSVIGNQIMIDNIEPITSGTVGATIDLAFSSEWEKLSKTAVFKAGNVVKDVANVDGIVAIPWEVLEKPNRQLYIGVKGFNEEGTLVIPTSYAFINNITAGTVTSASNEPPTPSVIEQIQAQVDNAESMAQEVLDAYKNGELNGKDYEHSEEFSQLAEQVRADAGTAESEAEKAGAFKSDAASSASSAANEAGQAAASAASAAQSASAAAEDARVAKAANEITLGNATRAEAAEAAAEQSASGILGQAEKAESAASLASAKAAVALNAATESGASANTSAEFAGHARKSADAAKKAVASIGTSVQDCETYASRATEAANSAAQSASDALTAQQAAAQSAQQAAGSLDTVKADANRASNAAGAADQSAEDAHSFATAAYNSREEAQNANTQVQDAKSWVDQQTLKVQDSAATATGAADRAAASEQTATTAAGTATSKATEATTQATKATQEADRAKQEADKAAGAVKGIIDDTTISAETAYSSQKTNAEMLKMAIKQKATGDTISIDDSADWPLVGLTLYGKTVQSAAPTPTAPAPLMSTGASGTTVLSVGPEPETAYAFATPGGLSGVPDLNVSNYTDGDGTKWTTDELDAATGVKIQRCVVVNVANFLGSIQAWDVPNCYKMNANYNYYRPNPPGHNFDKSNILCDRFQVRSYFIGGDTGNPAEVAGFPGGVAYGVYGELAFNMTGIPGVKDVPTAKQWFLNNPTKVLLCLQKPVKTTIQKADIFNTRYPRTTIKTDQPAGIGVRYVADPENYFSKILGRISNLEKNAIGGI